MGGGGVKNPIKFKRNIFKKNKKPFDFMLKRNLFNPVRPRVILVIFSSRLTNETRQTTTYYYLSLISGSPKEARSFIIVLFEC